MYSGGRHTAGFAATLLVLLFAFSLRALVPVGYMPVVDADGLHLVVCDPAAPAGGGDDHKDGHHGGHDDDHDEGPAGFESGCVFAAAAPAAGPADPPPLPRPPVLVFIHESRPPFRDPPPTDRSEGPPPPARAPPLSI